MKTTLKAAAALLLINTVSAKPKKVLFVAVDDLRVEPACDGAGHMKTPHTDQLASEGLLFERACCQQAICGPSNISINLIESPGHADTARIMAALLKAGPNAARP